MSRISRVSIVNQCMFIDSVIRGKFYCQFKFLLKKQFIIGIILLLVFLLVVEIIVNIWLHFFYICDFEKNEIFKDVNPELNRKMCLESLGFGFTTQKISYVKGTSPQYGGLDKNLVNINSHGFRGPEISEVKPENTYRIFVLGGSTAFGAGVLDNQTHPYYLGRLYDEANLNFKVEVINAGWPGRWSLQEVEAAKEIIQNFEPDLFIVYDGFNDLAQMIAVEHPEASGILWKQRWLEVCENGKQNGYATIITLQPSLGSGKKIMTEQEYTNFVMGKRSVFLDRYPELIDELDGLKDHCSLAVDLRGIFDNIQEPLFYDAGHTGFRGNQIIAKNLFQLSLPIVLEGAKNNIFNQKNQESSTMDIDTRLVSNDFEEFLENSYFVFRDVISLYQTPRVLPLIFQ